MLSLIFLAIGWDLGWRGYPRWSPLAAAVVVAVAITLVGLLTGAGSAGAASAVLGVTGALVAVLGYVGYGVGRLARRLFGGGKRYSIALPQIGR